MLAGRPLFALRWFGSASRRLSPRWHSSLTRPSAGRAGQVMTESSSAPIRTLPWGWRSLLGPRREYPRGDGGVC
eukprot:363620-Chlamydomonas_euryale.AAC.8